MTEQKLSTSRIAELAGIDSKALFALLSESDWIKRENGILPPAQQISRTGTGVAIGMQR